MNNHANVLHILLIWTLQHFKNISKYRAAFHVACETVGVPIFKHLIAKRALVFFSQLINTKSPCVSPYRHYLRYNSYIKNNLSILFERNYQVRNFHSNPLCALIARINYVERTEPRRSDTFHV